MPLQPDLCPQLKRWAINTEGHLVFQDKMTFVTRHYDGFVVFQILGTSRTLTYIRERSIVDPVGKKMELCSTNVSSGHDEQGAWYFLVMVRDDVI